MLYLCYIGIKRGVIFVLYRDKKGVIFVLYRDKKGCYICVI